MTRMRGLEEHLALVPGVVAAEAHDAVDGLPGRRAVLVRVDLAPERADAGAVVLDVLRALRGGVGADGPATTVTFTTHDGPGGVERRLDARALLDAARVARPGALPGGAQDGWAASRRSLQVAAGGLAALGDVGGD